MGYPVGRALQELDRFRQERVDQIEVCLMHCMTNDKWPVEPRVCDELAELKDKKVVRAVGVL